jgi:hypothetical protein
MCGEGVDSKEVIGDDSWVGVETAEHVWCELSFAVFGGLDFVFADDEGDFLGVDGTD